MEEKPNAIMLGEALPELERACGAAKESLPSDAKIGKVVVQAPQLEIVKRDLTERPPKEFNVAGIELVFSSMIKFVEFKVEGYKLSKKVAPIPSDLLGLSEDSELKDRWRNAFRMFDGESKFVVDIPRRNEKGEELPDKPLMKYGEVLLEKERQKIEQDFLFKVHGFGVVIFRSRRKAFDQRIEQFKMRLDDYAKAIAQQIQASAEVTITSLAATLLPLVTKKPPARYLKSASSTPTSDELRQQLVDDLRNKFGITVKTPPVDLKPDNQQSAGNTAGQSNIGEESKQPDEPDGFMKPTAKVLFKDIAYETIHHKGFKEALIKAGIAKNRVDELFQEHDAAPEKDKTNQPQSKP